MNLSVVTLIRSPTRNSSLKIIKSICPAKLWTAQVNANDDSEDAKYYTRIYRCSARFSEWTLGTIVLDEFYQVWEQSKLRIGLG